MADQSRPKPKSSENRGKRPRKPKSVKSQTTDAAKVIVGFPVWLRVSRLVSVSFSVTGSLAHILSNSQGAKASEVSKLDANAPECLICFMSVEHYTVTPCMHSHGICGTCALRMRLFLKREKKEEKKGEVELKEEAKIWECPFCKVSCLFLCSAFALWCSLCFVTQYTLNTRKCTQKHAGALGSSRFLHKRHQKAGRLHHRQKIASIRRRHRRTLRQRRNDGILSEIAFDLLCCLRWQGQFKTVFSISQLDVWCLMIALMLRCLLLVDYGLVPKSTLC